jgi:hypothetical protein
MSAPINPHDILRTQMLLSMGFVGGFSGVRNIIVLSLFDKAVQTFSNWFPNVKAFCCRRSKSLSSTPPPPTNKDIKATIECERIYQSPGNRSAQTQQPNGNHAKMDAIIHFITTIPAIRNLICMTHHDYLPHEFEPVQLEPDIYFQLINLKHNDGQVEMISFKLFCFDHEVQYLQAFIDRCNLDYERRMANKLGTSLYFFDMMTNSKTKKTVQNTLPTSHIIYTKHKFHTTRSFDNVFFEQREKVQKHVEFFLTRKDWYEKKGIPYTLGFMFHGEPGTGKTSSVKAIANTARRHIINVQLSEIKTKAQLRHLFFNDEIHVHNGITTERYTIPVHERLYVIEDIDAMGDAVLRREWKRPEPTKEEKKKSSGDAWMDREEEEFKDPIDLSFLLNLLDGTLEASGRILAISSNFPERIDRALIRPGRIDMIIHFKKCNRTILNEMVSNFYDIENFEGFSEESMDYKWSPAEVNQILFRNFDKPDEAISELKTLNPRDLYGFEIVQNGSNTYAKFLTENVSPSNVDA